MKSANQEMSLFFHPLGWMRCSKKQKYVKYLMHLHGELEVNKYENYDYRGKVNVL